MKRSKAYQDADAKIDHEALYSPVEAIDLASDQGDEVRPDR